MLPDVVVIGGGIAGLAAAYHAAKGGARVTVLEAGSAVGGKLKASEIAGVAVDEGAEAMLARRPEGLELVRDLGLAERLVYPGTTTAAIWSRGALHDLPTGHVMGVPADLVALARSRLLSPAGMLRVPLDLVRAETPRGDDVSVAEFVGARVGREVVDRLVEPLLGGVYAGRADELSFEATLGGLAGASRSHRSLIAAARAARPPGGGSGPVFASVTGGLGTLPEALVTALTGLGGVVRTGVTVSELRRGPAGWRLTAGSQTLEADAVIVAVPAPAARRLLRHEVPAAAAELDRIDYASMAIVTLAYGAAAFAEPLRRSGYLVPAVEHTDVKAVTFSSVKWPHLTGEAPGTVFVRCSIGRYGEADALRRPDEELVAAAMTELSRTSGVLELPVATRVTRWGGGLPQYTVGHLDRVARIRAAVAGQPGLAVCGAAYDGIGIPACVASARAAVARILVEGRPNVTLRGARP